MELLFRLVAKYVFFKKNMNISETLQPCASFRKMRRGCSHLKPQPKVLLYIYSLCGKAQKVLESFDQELNISKGAEVLESLLKLCIIISL